MGPPDQDFQSLRAEFVEEVRSRLIGPCAEEEEMRERPNKRYLTGMLFPRGTSAGSAAADEEELPDDESTEEDDGELESPMDLLFQRLPASVGLTFAITDNETVVRAEVAAAAYSQQPAKRVAETAGRTEAKAGRCPTVWKRVPLPEGGGVETVDLPAMHDGRFEHAVLAGRVKLHLFIRRAQATRIVTVSLVNTRECGVDSGVSPEDILFQVRLACRPSCGVPAYPGVSSVSEDEEAEDLTLQYRMLPPFAVGHGCGATWPEPTSGAVEFVAVDFMPTVEVPPVTTDIEALPRAVLEALSLARLQHEQFDPCPGLSQLITSYRDWRNRLATVKLSPRFGKSRERTLLRIDSVLHRMEDGLQLLRANARALQVFKLTNRAMLLSMARSASNKSRPPGVAFKDVSLAAIESDAFRWRPFQMAFILLSLRGLWEPEHADRQIVDLIWFGTGGGKTEAYLAVAAFEMLRRRFVDAEKGHGTAVIKRYTLRLLTIQQFERAGSLICALETLRRAGALPGSEAFSLGLWVGKDSSPNEYGGRDGALAQLGKIRSTVGRVEGVKVPLKQCPVCATPVVPVRKEVGDEGVGIREVQGRVELFCPNRGCIYHDGLPISFIDDYLYEHPPTMLLGTIDKFAMLAWRDEARAFFGTDRGVAPPSLIIQDELHLISGPLGTLAGIYEAAIDTAISRLGPCAKYICATATIRRAGDQIRKLYGREAQLFPPPGLDATDSFFSRVQRGAPGRLYVGAMGQGHTPTFSNVIAATSLLAAAGELRHRVGDLVDTWWTLVAYHNSKRELGKTLSLARDDIPARLNALGERRKVRGSGVLELSANLKDSDIPEALHQLALALPDSSVLDFVACTNMLSVGVDIQRLGLMMVNGQPKTVSEYIQASSRVGRDENRPPGVVFSLLSPSKPRDRSHYEFFRVFHKAFYRHVEPTSVTPFALPARDRGLHGAFLALTRMVSGLHANADASKVAANAREVQELADLMLERVRTARDGEWTEAGDRLTEFLAFWKQQAAQSGPKLRFQSGGKEHPSLIKPFREPGGGWETLQSLRHVDTPLKLIVPQAKIGPGGLRA